MILTTGVGVGEELSEIVGVGKGVGSIFTLVVSNEKLMLWTSLLNTAVHVTSEVCTASVPMDPETIPVIMY